MKEKEEKNQVIERISKEILEKSGIDQFTDVEIISAPVVRYCTEQSRVNVDDNCNTYSVQNSTDIIIQASTFQVSAVMSQKQISDLKDSHCVDANAFVINNLVSEMKNSMFRHYFDRIVQLSEASYRRSFTWWDRVKDFVYKLFGKVYQKKLKAKLANKLISRIIEECSYMDHITGTPSPSFIICSFKTAAILTNSSMYSANTNSSSEKLFSNNCCFQPSGKIAHILIYVTPYMQYADSRVFIGKKSEKNKDGLKLFFYKNGISIDTDESKDKKRITLKCRYAIKDVGVSAHDMYTKFIYTGLSL
jgi:hypothetical protein